MNTLVFVLAMIASVALGAHVKFAEGAVFGWMALLLVSLVEISYNRWLYRQQQEQQKGPK